EGVGATAAALVDLSTVAGNKISNPPWVKFQSAGWVNFPSAPTACYCTVNEARTLRVGIASKSILPTPQLTAPAGSEKSTLRTKPQRHFLLKTYSGHKPDQKPMETDA
ncbi:hypothetical protein, partial [Pseudomonas aeruginosa]|uniref:hypothetical protein n=1 Tax=Pseudomonas aeruginosa TaxID=287 RepID=UPI001C71C758